MFRTYTVEELEEISGYTRRTIGDYIAKGLLSGPSHRGRGARYSQADANLLQVIPRLRTLMKKEMPNIRSLNAFLSQLSARDVASLARKKSESTFVLEVRTLRARITLSTLLPQLAPERLTAVLDELSPEQIRSIDSGRAQLGAVIDMAALLREVEADAEASRQDRSVQPGDLAALESAMQQMEKSAGELTAQKSTQTADVKAQSTSEKLADIALRVDRLERLLAD